MSKADWINEPSAPGWWWYWAEGHNPWPVRVRADEETGTLYAGHWPVSDYKGHGLWLGPLEIPAPPNHISQRLKAARLAKGLILTEGAKGFGVRITVLGDIESGRLDPTEDLLAKAESLYGVRLADGKHS